MWIRIRQLIRVLRRIRAVRAAAIRRRDRAAAVIRRGVADRLGLRLDRPAGRRRVLREAVEAEAAGRRVIPQGLAVVRLPLRVAGHHAEVRGLHHRVVVRAAEGLRPAVVVDEGGKLL
jgi:hypothetical protein